MFRVDKQVLTKVNVQWFAENHMNIASEQVIQVKKCLLGLLKLMLNNHSHLQKIH